ncbi:MAG: class I SAM-dependent methyltransferase [Chloroflexi bacterium]|nr:MAG: class I SAM-dependent methyltransferase [Chloroflexota bacterium]
MYTFTRYLSAKKTVDDRALNQQVWHEMAAVVGKRPCSFLEIGAGIGTMVERLWGQDLLQACQYTAIDSQPENIHEAKRRLAPIATQINLEFEAIDLFDFIEREKGVRTWDVLIAHAFLDLMDIPAVLPQLFSLLSPGGYFYFTINFDGTTILQPTIDPAFDALVEHLYHRTMDERITAGKRSGDSQSGRHLFGQLREAGAMILAAGSSDWVVFAGGNGYLADEAYFLRFIIHTMEQALKDHPALDQQRFSKWIAQRHQQIEAGELVYIAHQLDFWGAIDKV